MEEFVFNILKIYRRQQLLKSYNSYQLKALASHFKLVGYSRLTKAELVEELMAMPQIDSALGLNVASKAA